MQTGSRAPVDCGSLASLALAAFASPPVAAPARAAAPVRPAVTTSGVHFVDRAGGIVILRGVDVSYQSRLVEKVIELHANFARVRVLWVEIEPRRGQFDAERAAAPRHVRRVPDGAPRERRARPARQGAPELGQPAAASTRATHRPPRRLSRVRAGDRQPVRGQSVRHRLRDLQRAASPLIWTASRRIAAGRPQDAASGRRASATRSSPSTPITTVFFNVRGGALGARACFRCAGFRLAHTALDWHDFYNGCCGSGLDATDDNWVPSWSETHNQLSTRYHGTAHNQWLNLAIPWRRTHLPGDPDDRRRMGRPKRRRGTARLQRADGGLMARHGISWARWDMDCTSSFGLVSHGRLNEQGRWLASVILGAG